MKHFRLAMALTAAVAFTACKKDSQQVMHHGAQDETDALTQVNGFTEKPPVIISESGDIQAAVQQFRDLLGPLSLNETMTGGRREINWDNVHLFMTNNNNFPGTYFNRTDPEGPFMQKTGVLLTTPGAGFRVSNNHFSDIDSSYNDEFIPFSGLKNLVALQSNTIDINFKKPGTDKTGYVQGFGVVFNDVNVEGSTTVTLYSGKMLIGTYRVKIADTGGASFLGIYLPGKKITRARLILGQSPIGKGIKDVCDSDTGYDLVALDDLIFSVPQGASLK